MAGEVVGPPQRSAIALGRCGSKIAWAETSAPWRRQGAQTQKLKRALSEEGVAGVVVMFIFVSLKLFLLGCNFFLSFSHTTPLYRHALLLTGEHKLDLQSRPLSTTIQEPAGIPQKNARYHLLSVFGCKTLSPNSVLGCKTPSPEGVLACKNPKPQKKCWVAKPQALKGMLTCKKNPRP